MKATIGINRISKNIWQAHAFAVSPNSLSHFKQKKETVLLKCQYDSIVMSFLQIQQKPVLHREHVILLHPEIFSTGTRHFGQFAISIILAQSRYRSYSSSVQHLPSCQSFPHLKHTSWPHSHMVRLRQRPGFDTIFPHPTFGHHFNFLFEPTLTSSQITWYFFASSSFKNFQTCSRVKLISHALPIIHGILIAFP